MNKFNRIVIKVGSSTLTYPNGKPNLKRIDKLCRVISDLKNRGVETVLVSSGAISVGVGKLGLAAKPAEIPLKQAAAAVGQVELMFIYDKFFSEYGQTVAQLLLTRDVVEESEKLENVTNCFETLIDRGAIPIINENDPVSVEELGFSENDTLSAVVAGIVRADLLIVLSDTVGFYDSDPNGNPEAKLITKVTAIDESVRAAAGGAGSVQGTGGMAAKLHAAETADSYGVSMLLASGEDPGILYEIFEGKKVGTLFCLGGKR